MYVINDIKIEAYLIQTFVKILKWRFDADVSKCR